MATIIKAPARLQSGFSVFLAGSIEMGAAVNWQTRVEKGLEDCHVLIFNPRRDDWDASWIQSAENAQFRQQVEWELEGLEKASIIAMYFDPSTKSPISLLELGLFARRDNMIACCPEGFWRKGNVDIVCDRYRINQVATLEELVGKVIDVVRLEARRPR
jgi:hypothetical protein